MFARIFLRPPPSAASPTREISILDIEYARLTYFDIKFACLSKYNIEHANSFDSGVFYLFLIFFPFYCSFLLNKDMKRRFYPWTYPFTVRYTAPLSRISLCSVPLLKNRAAAACPSWPRLQHRPASPPPAPPPPAP